MKMEAASDGLLARDKRAEETQAIACDLVPLANEVPLANKNFTAEPMTKFMLPMNTKASKRLRKTLIGSPVTASKLNKTMFICLQTSKFRVFKLKISTFL